MKKFLQTFLFVALASGPLLISSAQVVAAQGEFEGESVTVGLTAGSAEEVWQVVVEKALEDGIEVNLEIFTDYVQPNVALQDGSLDVNAFQHVAFLDDWNASNDGDLEPIGFTFVSPMGAYSDKISSLEELADGDVIGIPNDPTNGGRAILALEIAGIIEVDDEVGALATIADITANPLNLEFIELEAAQLPASLPDVAAAFINTNFATDAGLTLDDAIFVDSEHPEELNEAYKNVIAVRSEGVDNPLYQQLVTYYQTPEVAQAILDATAGADKPIWESADSVEDTEESEAETSADEAA